MATPDFIVGIIGNVISILVCASPVWTFRQVVKEKSAEKHDVLPYITTLMCKSLWAFYGVLDPDGLLIITVNSVCVATQIVYITLLLIYAPRNKLVKFLSLVAILNIVIPISAIVATLLAFQGSVQRAFIGVVCAILTVAMYAAPLSVMITVIKTKSVEHMSFFLSFFLLLNAGAWFTFAVLLKDYYVIVPNAVGLLLGSTQLIVYLIHMNKTSSTNTINEDSSLPGE